MEELEAVLARTKDSDEYDDDSGGEEELFSQDILEAFALLRKCTKMLDFLSDVDLCKGLTKRERESMGRLAEKVRDYLDETEQHYEEDEETDV